MTNSRRHSKISFYDLSLPIPAKAHFRSSFARRSQSAATFSSTSSASVMSVPRVQNEPGEPLLRRASASRLYGTLPSRPSRRHSDGRKGLTPLSQVVNSLSWTLGSGPTSPSSQIGPRASGFWKPAETYDPGEGSESDTDEAARVNGVRVWYSSFTSIDWLHDVVRLFFNASPPSISCNTDQRFEPDAPAASSAVASRSNFQCG